MLVNTAAAFHYRAKLAIGKAKLRHWLVSQGKRRTLTNGWRKQKLNGFVLVMLRGKQNGGCMRQEMHRAETMRMHHGKRDMQALHKKQQKNPCRQRRDRQLGFVGCAKNA